MLHPYKNTFCCLITVLHNKSDSYTRIVINACVPYTLGHGMLKYVSFMPLINVVIDGNEVILVGRECQ